MSVASQRLQGGNKYKTHCVLCPKTGWKHYCDQSSEISASPIKMMPQMFPEWIEEPQKGPFCGLTAVDLEIRSQDWRSHTLSDERAAGSCPQFSVPSGLSQMWWQALDEVKPLSGELHLMPRAEGIVGALSISGGNIEGSGHLPNFPEVWLSCPMKLHHSPISPSAQFYDLSISSTGVGSQEHTLRMSCILISVSELASWAIQAVILMKLCGCHVFCPKYGRDLGTDWVGWKDNVLLIDWGENSSLCLEPLCGIYRLGQSKFCQQLHPTPLPCFALVSNGCSRLRTKLFDLLPFKAGPCWDWFTGNVTIWHSRHSWKMGTWS